MKTITEFFQAAMTQAVPESKAHGRNTSGVLAAMAKAAALPAIASLMLLTGCNTVAITVPSLQAELQPAPLGASEMAAAIASAGYASSGLGLRTTPSAAAAKPGNVVNGRVLIFQPTAMPGPAVARVRLSPVTVSRKFNGQPYNPAHVAIGDKIPATAPDNLSQWILVSGGYTPKGVYSRPDKTSRILTRVAPGARLRLEASFDGWLKVETGLGIGYLLADDAKQLSASNEISPKLKAAEQQEG